MCIEEASKEINQSSEDYGFCCGFGSESIVA
jgi:hypothetical protein